MEEINFVIQFHDFDVVLFAVCLHSIYPRKKTTENILMKQRIVLVVFFLEKSGSGKNSVRSG